MDDDKNKLMKEVKDYQQKSFIEEKKQEFKETKIVH